MNIFDSLKIKLYDSFNTSFLASFILSCIFFNHKYILIYFSEVKNLEEKLKYLNAAHINFETVVLFPLFMALLYTLVFPIFHSLILWATEGFKNVNRNIKIEAENKQTITTEEKTLILSELRDAKEQLIKKDQVVSLLSVEAQKDVKLRDKEIEELQKTINENIEENNTLIEVSTNLKTNEEQLIKKREDSLDSLNLLTKEHNEYKIQKDKELKNVREQENNKSRQLKEYIELYEKEKKGSLALQKNYTKVNNKLKELENIDSLYKKLEIDFKNGEDHFNKIVQERNELQVNISSINEKYLKLINLYEANGIDISFDTIEGLSHNELLVLEGLQNYSSNQEKKVVLNNLSNELKMPKVVVDQVLLNLVKNKYINKDEFGYLKLTKQGKQTIIKIISSNILD